MAKTKIIYKSGDGESWIESVYKYDELDMEVKQNLTEDENQKLEDTFSNIIFLHDHDNVTGYGAIVFDEHNNVLQSYYQKSED